MVLHGYFGSSCQKPVFTVHVLQYPKQESSNEWSQGNRVAYA
jgi:hypothetical protein